MHACRSTLEDPTLLSVTAFAEIKPAPTTKPHDFARWEKAIAEFEAQDLANPPPKNAILFVGSSTIVRWKTLAEDCPGQQVINRGFGGNQIVDSTHFAERMIFPYEPKMIFLRAGSNDIHAGKSAEQVFQDYKDFVAKIRTKLPKTVIVYMGMAPSPARWEERDTAKQGNALIKAWSETVEGLKYMETYDMTLNAAGEARPELFVADQLHFNAEGYKLLAERTRPFLPK